MDVDQRPPVGTAQPGIVFRRRTRPGWHARRRPAGVALVIDCACGAEIPQPDGGWIDGSGRVHFDLSCASCGAQYPAGMVLLDGYPEWAKALLRSFGVF